MNGLYFGNNFIIQIKLYCIKAGTRYMIRFIGILGTMVVALITFSIYCCLIVAGEEEERMEKRNGLN